MRELVAALGVPDLFVGLPSSEWERAAVVLPPEMSGPSPAMDEMAVLAFTNPADLLVPGVANTPAWRDAEIPAANGHGTARALATLYDSAFVDSVPEVSSGPDEVLKGNTRFGLGFMLPNEVRPYWPNPRAFGHTGAGGALAFRDPDLGIGFGYTPNRMILSAAGPDPRWSTILEALY